jgi:hypothetical protein
MKLVNEFVAELIKQWQLGDAPINVLIDDKYYEITDFYFDEETFEYMLKIEKGVDYKSRGDTKEIWKVVK